jgi:NAD(P)-dependent dehydrogenase (short-subunit alcohol dehydrogenase family)
MISTTVATYGRLDCAHNNAGVGARPRALLHELTEESWDRVLSINLKGVWLCMKYEIIQMLKQGGGAIVNTASIMGLVGSWSRSGAYNASKHGVVGLTKTAALEYATSGIRVNCVCPGYIRTPLIEETLRSRPEMEAQIVTRHPVGRMGRPEEIAEAVVWLCSEAASFVTGHTMTVDGGYVAQ